MKLTKKQLSKLIETIVLEESKEKFVLIKQPHLMKLSQAGKRDLRTYECSSDKSSIYYKNCCSGKIYSVEGEDHIGIGHLIKDEEKYDKDTQLTGKQIEDLFDEDIESHTQWKHELKEPISQYMFDAMTSLSFHAGPGSITGMINLINNKKYDEAAALIPKIGNGHKFVKRRTAEYNTFIKRGEPSPVSDDLKCSDNSPSLFDKAAEGFNSVYDYLFGDEK